MTSTDEAPPIELIPLAELEADDTLGIDAESAADLGPLVASGCELAVDHMLQLLEYGTPRDKGRARNFFAREWATLRSADDDRDDAMDRFLNLMAEIRSSPPADASLIHWPPDPRRLGAGARRPASPGRIASTANRWLSRRRLAEATRQLNTVTTGTVAFSQSSSCWSSSFGCRSSGPGSGTNPGQVGPRRCPVVGGCVQRRGEMERHAGGLGTRDVQPCCGVPHHRAATCPTGCAPREALPMGGRRRHPREARSRSLTVPRRPRHPPPGPLFGSIRRPRVRCSVQ